MCGAFCGSFSGLHPTEATGRIAASPPDKLIKIIKNEKVIQKSGGEERALYHRPLPYLAPLGKRGLFSDDFYASTGVLSPPALRGTKLFPALRIQKGECVYRKRAFSFGNTKPAVKFLSDFTTGFANYYLQI